MPAEAGEDTAGVRGESDSDDATWLKAQPPDNYTIQLAAIQNPQRVAAYLGQFKLNHRVRILLLNRNRTALYHVVMGSFADKKLAEEALRALPGTLREDGAWGRKFGELQPHVAGAETRPQSVKVPD